MSALPEPANRNINTSTDVRRGAMYYYTNVNGEEIRVSILGIASLAECPSIGGLNTAHAIAGGTSGRSCYYRLPHHTGS